MTPMQQQGGTIVKFEGGSSKTTVVVPAGKEQITEK